MHHRRYCDDHLFEVTQRTNRGECLFDCNDQGLRAEIDGLLAHAQERYGVAIYAYHFMSNHYHGLFGAPSAQQFADFLAYFHGGLARLVNRCRGQRGHVWGGRARVVAVATDEASLVSRLRYILGQASRAGMVTHPLAFPGSSSSRALAYGESIVGRTVNWTAQCRDRRLVGGPKSADAYETLREVKLSPLPCWSHVNEAARRRLYRAITDDVGDQKVEQKAPLCQTHESAAENRIAIAKVADPVDDAGRPRLVGDVANRGRAPLILAATEVQRKAYRELLKAFEAEYAAARAELLRQVSRKQAGLRVRAVTFPRFSFPGGGLRGL
ncbi:MAG: transposase [Deltaproteobacteria bacterium]|nr:transposase [Deltaproteobacteria bacterium]